MEKKKCDSLHGNESSERVSKEKTNQRERIGGITITFPIKLHSMLQELSSTDIYSDIIKWSATGDSFVIFNPNAFTKSLLPKYFRTHKLTSFQRQLNAYGFTKFNLYACRDGYHVYYHKHFLRDNVDRLRLLNRKHTLDCNDLLNLQGQQISLGTKFEREKKINALRFTDRTTITKVQQVLFSQPFSERNFLRDNILDQAVELVIEKDDSDFIQYMINLFNTWNPITEVFKNDDDFSYPELMTDYFETPLIAYGANAPNAITEYSDLINFESTSDKAMQWNNDLCSQDKYIDDEASYSLASSESSTKGNKNGIKQLDENDELSEIDSLSSICFLLLDKTSDRA